MKDITFCEDDDFGILANSSGMPYVAVKLTKEQANDVEKSVAGIYEIDGKQLFNIKDSNGILTGEKMLYVVFVKK